MKARTSDERFVLSLYETAQASENMDDPHDRYAVGQRVGLSPKAVDAICKLLVQANFIKRADGDTIYLTKHGESLALRLLDEK